MKGSEKVVDMLNTILRQELAGMMHYMLYSRIWKYWGHDAYKILSNNAYMKKRDAGQVMSRILFLEGMPDVQVDKVDVSMNVETQLRTILAMETAHRDTYLKTIALAQSEQDYVTAQMLMRWLPYAEENIDWAEQQLTKMQYVGAKAYIGSQKTLNSEEVLSERGTVAMTEDVEATLSE